MLRALLAGAIGLVVVPTTLADGLRVACWNIEFYNGGRETDLRTSVYGVFNGRSLAPDAFLLQEFDGQTAANTFASILNAAPQSTGDWAAAPVFDNGNDNNVLVYRTSRLTLLNSVLVAAGSTSANPRNVVRHDVRLFGYSGEAATISIFPVHYKAGGTGTDATRRQAESVAITNNIATLPANRAVILGGDFNIPSSNEQSFRTLVGTTYNTGPFRDPVTIPGSWQNNNAFRFIHTQDPSNQMDDRYDLMLVTPSLVDGAGLDYIGNFASPWDLSTWNDPDHSYRCWGNDGTSFDTLLTTTNNQNVGATIALALRTVSDHLPVVMDIRVPARLLAPFFGVNLGALPAGAASTFPVAVGSAGDVVTWGMNGIEETRFTFIPGPGIAAPAGVLTDAAGGSIPEWTLTLDATSLPPGPFSSYVDIVSNDPAFATLRVAINATLTGPVNCNPADYAEAFGTLDINDILVFANLFNTTDPAADLFADLMYDINDVLTFAAAFNAGCP